MCLQVGVRVEKRQRGSEGVTHIANGVPPAGRPRLSASRVFDSVDPPIDLRREPVSRRGVGVVAEPGDLGVDPLELRIIGDEEPSAVPDHRA